MLKPVNQNPPGMLYQGEQKEKKRSLFLFVLDLSNISLDCYFTGCFFLCIR